MLYVICSIHTSQKLVSRHRLVEFKTCRNPWTCPHSFVKVHFEMLLLSYHRMDFKLLTSLGCASAARQLHVSCPWDAQPHRPVVFSITVVAIAVVLSSDCLQFRAIEAIEASVIYCTAYGAFLNCFKSKIRSTNNMTFTNKWLERFHLFVTYVETVKKMLNNLTIFWLSRWYYAITINTIIHIEPFLVSSMPYSHLDN